MKLLTALAAAASFACDPVYSLHLRARVTDHGAPLAGAWVMGLDSASLRPPVAVRTGADGTVEVEFRGFLRNPAADPLAVAAGAGAILIALPDRDFIAHKRGLFFGHASEAILDAALPGPPPELSLRCEGSSCEVEGPDLPCAVYELYIDSSGAQGHALAAPPRTAEVGRQKVSFKRSSPAPGLVVAAVCAVGEGKLRALVSNPIASP
jgi:hypothetical protein